MRRPKIRSPDVTSQSSPWSDELCAGLAAYSSAVRASAGSGSRGARRSSIARGVSLDSAEVAWAAASDISSFTGVPGDEVPANSACTAVAAEAPAAFSASGGLTEHWGSVIQSSFAAVASVHHSGGVHE